MKEYKQGRWIAMEGLGDEFILNYRGHYVGKYYPDCDDLALAKPPHTLMVDDILDLYNLIKQIQ